MANDIGIKIGLEGLAAYNRGLREVESNTGRTFAGVGNSFSRSSQSFRDLARDIPGVGTAIALLSNPIGAAISGVTTLVATFASFVNTAAEFESQLATVGALLGVDRTTEEFAALNEEAKRLGATTEFSANQAAQAMEFLARAGFNANETLKGTEDTLSLATVGALDLGRAADIATDTLSQFQKPVEELGSVVDIIAKTTVTANTNVTQFADAMNYLGPTANALGISLEESSAAIGILSSSGLKGSLATRALGTSLVRLTKPTAEAAATMERFNISAFDENGDFIGLAGLVGQLETAFSGLTQQQEQSALASIFGAEAIQEINILLGKGSKELARYTAEIEEAGEQNGGFAAGIRAIKLDTFEGAIIQIKSAFEALKIELTDGSLPVLRELGFLFADSLRAGVSLVAQFGNLGTAISDNSAIIALAATAFAAYNASAISAAFTAIPTLIKNIFVLSDTQKSATIIQTAYSAVTTAFNGLVQVLTGRIRLLTVAQRALNVVQRANPLGILITVLGTAGAAYLAFNNRSKEAVEIAREEKNVREEVIKGISGEVTALQGLFGPLTNENASRAEKKSAIDAINRQYGGLLSNMLSEKSNAEDIAKAYQEITRQLIIKQVAQRREEELNALVAQSIQFEEERAQRTRDANAAREESLRLTESEVDANRRLGDQLDFLARQEQNFLDNTAEITQANADQINLRYDNLVDSILNNLEGLDLGFLGNDVRSVGDAADDAEKGIESLADRLASLGVSLPDFNEFEGLSNLSDQTDEVRDKAREARDAIVTLAEDPNAPISDLRDQVSNLREALSLLPPEAEGIKAIAEEVIRLEDQLREAERQIERTFLDARLDGVEFDVIANVEEIVIPPLDPIAGTLDLLVNVPPIGDEPFLALKDAAKVLDVDFELLNSRFSSTEQLLETMDSNAFKFAESLGATTGEALLFAESLDELKRTLGEQFIFDLANGFSVLGQEIASVIQGSQSLGGAFDTFAREALATVIETGTRLTGLFLLQSAVGLGFPAGVPLAIAGAALAGLSGLLPALILGDDPGTQPVEFATPSLTGGNSIQGPALATNQVSALGLSDLGENQSQVVNITLQVDGQDLADAVSFNVLLDQQLTGG